MDQLARHLADKAAARVGLRLAEEAAGLGVREEELLAGARDGHVGQAALLFNTALEHGVAVREDGLLHAGHEDDVELEALGGVDGHERDLFLGVVDRVEVRAQREPLHEVCQRGRMAGKLLAVELKARLQGRLLVFDQRVRLDVFLHNREELADVFCAGVCLLGALGLKGGHQARLLDDHVDHVVEGALVRAGLVDDGDEGLQRLAGVGTAGRVEALLAGGLEEAHAPHVRSGLYALDGGLADAASRGVDHTQGGDVVGGVHGELEVGHAVADLHAVEEAGAAHDLVGHAGAQEHVLERARLRVGAVEERDVVVACAGVVQLLDAAGDPAAFVALVCGQVEPDLVAVWAAGEQALVLARAVVGDDRVGRGQDVAAGAVVLFELDRLGGGPVALEVEDVADVCTAP